MNNAKDRVRADGEHDDAKRALPFDAIEYDIRRASRGAAVLRLEHAMAGIGYAAITDLLPQ